MDPTVGYILAIIVVALAFDFINGFHDSANSIATVVATRVLSPGAAVIWAATFNFVAAFLVGTAVAKTIGKGLVDPAVLDPDLILAALLGAILWNLITWWLGLPSSSSHALMGGLGGAALAKAGAGALIPAGWVKPILFIFLVAAHRPGPGTGAHRSALVDSPSVLARADGPGVSATPTSLRGAVFHRARGQRRAEDDGDHRRPAGLPAGTLPRARPAGCRTSICRVRTRSRFGSS